MPPLYLRIPSGFKQEVNDVLVEPLMYQPTPLGIKLLCEHYAKKYNIDLQQADLSLYEELSSGNNLGNNFRCFKRNYKPLLNVEEGQLRGVILTYQQFHAVPILISKHSGKT